MGSLSVIRPGIQTQIQDVGRPGFAFFGIPTSGALDQQHAQLGNVLLSQPSDRPVIECHLTAPQIQFHSRATICLTGADMHWMLNAKRQSMNCTIDVRAGDILTGRSSVVGCRAYISIRGEIETNRHFESSACYALAEFGGNNGRVFSAGDTLTWKESHGDITQLELHKTFIVPSKIQVLPGPEYEWLTSQSRQDLVTSQFCVGPDSNRMGSRLSGPKLETAERHMAASVPVLPGIIQLTPSGQCVVILRDSQTTGGYPRILWLAETVLSAFCQIAPQQSFRFDMCED